MIWASLTSIRKLLPDASVYEKCTPTVDMNMMTPSKIGTKIRCIIMCCVRGNVDENADEEKDVDEEEEEMD